MKSFLDDYVINKNNHYVCRCCPNFKPVKNRAHWDKHITTWKHTINKNPKYKSQTQIDNNLLDEVNDVESFVVNKDRDYVCKCCPNFNPVNKQKWLIHSKSNKHKKHESLIKLHLDKEVLNKMEETMEEHQSYINKSNLLDLERNEIRIERAKLKEDYKLRHKNLDKEQGELTKHILAFHEEKALLSTKHELLEVLMQMNLEIYSMTIEDRYSNTLN